MNISYNWLKEYVDFDLTPEEVSAALTSLGLETDGVEKVETIKGGLEGLVIGKVLTCVDHPDSDHLHVTTVDLGQGEPSQIVCGAPNVAAGQHVVVATLGTKLYDGDKEFTIKKSKIRGVESFGMICAEDEIGVGTSHDGIIVLPDDTVPGTPAKEYYNIKDDYVFEVDLTPNRIDAASHYGVARDLAAWLRRHGKQPNLRRPPVDAFRPDRADGAVEVTIDNEEACPRYSGVTIRNVKVAESPEWLRNYLNTIGQRPINNIVDITNFILNSMCQPLHCFDLAKAKGNKIVVRTVDNGTKFTTLDGVEHTLTDKDLMICNAEEPMCIAGVFGGLDSGVTETTTDIFLESACFHPTWIRKTARRQGLSTDASFRYERGVDPNNTVYAVKLAALLVKEIAGGEICGEVFDHYPAEVKRQEVSLSYDYVNSLIGKTIEPEVVKSILESLEMEITAEHDGTLELLVPTYRVDVTRPCDVVEDILRVYGYNNVEFGESLKSSLSYRQATDESSRMQTLISEQLTAEGFYEIMNNSLSAVSYYEPLQETYPLANCVRLLNPLSNDLAVLRQTLIFGGLESLSHNINRKNPDLLMYEFGNCYFLNPEKQSTAEAPLAPYSETYRLGLWMTGNVVEGNWAVKSRKSTVYDMKAVVGNIFARLGVNGDIVESQTSNELFSAAIEYKTRNGKTVGHAGIVARKMCKAAEIEQEVYFAELDWMTLLKLSMKKKMEYTDLPKTMPVKRDLALLVDSAVTFAERERVVRSSEKKLLKSVSLFDVYEGKNLEAGKKSYAISLTLQDDEKTLTDKQIDSVMSKIVANLQKQTGAKLR